MSSTTELTQEQLLNMVANAMDGLRASLGNRTMIPDIQTYLKERYGVKASLERIKEATDIIAELEDGDCPE